MEEQLIEYFSKFYSLTDQEKEIITDDMVISDFAAKTVLLEEGKLPLDNYFILSGCVRQYYLSDGEEKNTNFYMEEEWVLPAIGAIDIQASKSSLQCTEDSKIVVANESKGNDLLKKFPKFQELSQIILEREIIGQQQRMITYQNSTPEERYLDLLENRPTLLQRVPQYQLSNYIGVKPESFSRIRKRLLDNGKA